MKLHHSKLLALLALLVATMNKTTAFQSPSLKVLSLAHQRFNRIPIIATTKPEVPSPLGGLSSSVISSKKNHSRRDVIQAASACLLLWLTRPKAVMARPKEQKDLTKPADDINLQIKTTFPKDFSLDDFGPKSCLFITVKPAVTYTDQVPQHVADSSLAKTGHWVPDVLRYKHSCSSLLSSCDAATPASITLTNKHMTPEGAADSLWWKTLPLVITVKLDDDGVAGTVGPKDLVGCKILLHHSKDMVHNGEVTLPLQKRGICSDLFSSPSSSTTST